MGAWGNNLSENSGGAGAVSCSVVPGRSRIRRSLLCIAGLMSVVLGLSIRTLSDAAWTGPAGDGLYAVLVYILVAILIPSKSKALIAAAAVIACVVIELFQLTGPSCRTRRILATPSAGPGNHVRHRGSVSLRRWCCRRLYGGSGHGHGGELHSPSLGALLSCPPGFLDRANRSTTVHPEGRPLQLDEARPWGGRVTGTGGQRAIRRANWRHWY